MSLRRACSVMVVGLAMSASNATAQTVLQWNLRNDCAYNDTCRNNEIQYIANLNPRPSIVTIQEIPGTKVDSFAADLSKATNQTWDYVYSAHKASDCNSDFDQGVAILTTFTVTEKQFRTFPYADQYVCARAAARIKATINGQSVQIFTSHNTLGDPAGNTRDFVNWAATFSGPRLISCDCNTDPLTVAGLIQPTAVDAWTVAGVGEGLTWNNSGTPVIREDFWFSDASDQFVPVLADNPPQSYSDHRAVRVVYAPNLLAKAGFEEYTPPSLGTPGWIDDFGVRQGHAISDSSHPRSGAKHGACYTDASHDCGTHQEMYASAAGTYTVVIFATSDRTGGLVGVTVNNQAIAYANVEARGLSNYGSPYVFTFTAAANDFIEPWAYSPATAGSLVVDDVGLVVNTSANLIVRGGFEEYAPPSLGPPGWLDDFGVYRTGHATSATSQPHTGAKHGICSTDSSHDCGTHQDINAPATGTYVLSLYANANITTGIVGVSVAGTALATAAVQSRGTGNYGTVYRLTFFATANQLIQPWLYSPGSGWVVIDDATLVRLQ